MGETIEHCASSFTGKTPTAPLTPAQMQTMACRMVKGWASGIGIVIGCILGMCPLLFLGDNRNLHFSDEEMTLYETCWRPYGVSPHAFFDVMKTAKWRDYEEGTTVVEAGKALDRVLLVASGALDSFERAPEGHLRRLYRYRSKADIAAEDLEKRAPKESRVSEEVPTRGCVIGGTALLDASVRDFPYPSTVIAVTKTRIVEWRYEKLRKEMEDEKAIEAAMFSILYFDLVEGLKRKHGGQDRAGAHAGDEQILDDKSRGRAAAAAPGEKKGRAAVLEAYETLLSVALQGGLVRPLEREFIAKFCLTHQITDAEHATALRAFGWTKAQYDVGTRLSTMAEVLDDHARIKEAIPDLLLATGVRSRIATMKHGQLPDAVAAASLGRADPQGGAAAAGGADAAAPEERAADGK